MGGGGGVLGDCELKFGGGGGWRGGGGGGGSVSGTNGGGGGVGGTGGGVPPEMPAAGPESLPVASPAAPRHPVILTDCGRFKTAHRASREVHHHHSLCPWVQTLALHSGAGVPVQPLACQFKGQQQLVPKVEATAPSVSPEEFASGTFAYPDWGRASGPLPLRASGGAVFLGSGGLPLMLSGVPTG